MYSMCLGTTCQKRTKPRCSDLLPVLSAIWDLFFSLRLSPDIQIAIANRKLRRRSTSMGSWPSVGIGLFGAVPQQDPNETGRPKLWSTQPYATCLRLVLKATRHTCLTENDSLLGGVIHRLICKYYRCTELTLLSYTSLLVIFLSFYELGCWQYSGTAAVQHGNFRAAYGASPADS